MSIYTKKGDDGTTGLFKKNDGKLVRVSKYSQIIDAIGNVDEANSYIGIINSKLKSPSNGKIPVGRQNLRLITILEEIQRDLFTIGAGLAGSELEIQESRTKNFESEMDKMENKLPKITGFILSGGSEISAHLMYARALVRKAERKIVSINDSRFTIPDSILKYMNRLSDYLFVLARWVNWKMGIKEEKWKE